MGWIASRRGMRIALPAAGVASTLALALAVGCGSSDSNGSAGLPGGSATLDQTNRGRVVVLSSGCGDCHNLGKTDPSDPKWLSGYAVNANNQGTYDIGPFKTYAANLTPDATGLGGATDRQVYNALKYGLDPEDTPDVVITGTTPGQGNFPATPHYLAPPMPWPSFRHLPDSDLWAIVAYLKHGIKAVANTVPDSQGPGDFWAGSYSAANIGPADIPAYPTTSESFNP